MSVKSCGVGGGGGSLGGSAVRLSLDPIDRSPLGHLIKFTQRSFPLY